jgi:hypothetical protein
VASIDPTQFPIVEFREFPSVDFQESDKALIFLAYLYVIRKDIVSILKSIFVLWVRCILACIAVAALIEETVTVATHSPKQMTFNSIITSINIINKD